MCKFYLHLRKILINIISIKAQISLYYIKIIHNFLYFLHFHQWDCSHIPLLSNNTNFQNIRYIHTLFLYIRNLYKKKYLIKILLITIQKSLFQSLFIVIMVLFLLEICTALKVGSFTMLVISSKRRFAIVTLKFSRMIVFPVII